MTQNIRIAKGARRRSPFASIDEAVAAIRDGQMIIVCDEANLRSAAVPQRLGYTLDRVEARAPEAPGETGRMQIWVKDREVSEPPTG